MQLNGGFTPQTRLCAELGGELLKECPEQNKIEGAIKLRLSYCNYNWRRSDPEKAGSRGRPCVYKIEFLSGQEGFTNFGQWEEQQEVNENRSPDWSGC